MSEYDLPAVTDYCESCGVLHKPVSDRALCGAVPVTCTKCGCSSTDEADFMPYLDGPRCTAYFACSRRQDVRAVAEKYGLSHDAAEKIATGMVDGFRAAGLNP